MPCSPIWNSLIFKVPWRGSFFQKSQPLGFRVEALPSFSSMLWAWGVFGFGLERVLLPKLFLHVHVDPQGLRAQLWRFSGHLGGVFRRMLVLSRSPGRLGEGFGKATELGETEVYFNTVDGENPA